MYNATYKVIEGTPSEIETELNNLGSNGSVKIINSVYSSAGRLAIILTYNTVN